MLVGNYLVDFIYGEDSASLLLGRNINGRRRYTNCAIFKALRNQPLELLASETAVCNPKDRFAKSIGRKTALKKALKQANFTREERKKIWGAYFKHFTK